MLLPLLGAPLDIMTITYEHILTTVGIGYCDYLGTWPKQSKYPIFVTRRYDLLYQKTKSKAASSHNIRYLTQGGSHNIR